VTHTQGPLSVHPYTTPPWQEVGAGAGHDAFRCASICIGAGRKIVAQVSAQTPSAGFPQVDNEAELVANAALFIAAPLLLEALIEVSKRCGPLSKDGGMARAAIAKARDTASVQAALDGLRPATPSISQEGE